MGNGSVIRKRALGRRLRELREAAGLTLEVAAPRLDWSTSTLSRIETGQQAPHVHGVQCLRPWRYADSPPDALAQPLRAALYLRVSEDKTGEALAVARQREDTTALVERRGWSVAREFTDNSVSAAGKVQRPQFAALLEAVRAGLVDVVVAWALDRLCRTARDRLALVEACRDAGVMIALVRGSDMDPTTPAGRLALGILGEVAQHEIDQKSDRQRRAVQQRAQAGLPATFTPAPFGWRDDRVTEHPVHGPALRAAAEHVLSGGSLGSVARRPRVRPVAASR